MSSSSDDDEDSHGPSTTLRFDDDDYDEKNVYDREKETTDTALEVASSSDEEFGGTFSIWYDRMTLVLPHRLRQ